MTEFTEPDLDALTPQELIDSVGIWYHKLDLGGLHTPGVYDMAEVLGHYGLPEDLSGQRVIDVGASNGAFSFEFERRQAAQVVATDLSGFEQHDYPRWYIEQERARRSADEIRRIDWDELHGGFRVAHKLLDSRVQRVLTRIYDLQDHFDGEFDLAFCSNVFIHLQNPVAAMESIRQVIKPGGRAIFATPITLGYEEVSAALFIGRAEYCAWWTPTKTGFVRMCEAAGFDDVQFHGSYPLARKLGEDIMDEIGVIHCRRPLG